MDKHLREQLAAQLGKLAKSSGTELFVSGRTLQLPNSFEELTHDTETRRIAFVDGGNAVLLAGAGFCVQHIRVAVILQQEKRWLRERYDAYVTITAQDARPTYAVELMNSTIPEAFSAPHIDGMRADLRDGAFGAKPERIGALVRRLAELHCALHCLKNKKPDVLVLDGELDGTSFEQEHLKQLHDLSATQGVHVVGLSKTSTSLTNKGHSGTALLLQKGPRQPWVMIPEQTTNPVTGFVKLHEKSKHVFRLDGCAAGDITFAAQALQKHANDPLLVGYPYGLIVADHTARVSQAEALVEQQSLLAQCTPEVQLLLSSTNAHEFF